MIILPYLGAGGVRFGARAESVVALLGPPLKRGTTRMGRPEAVYPELIVRFHPGEDRVIEITLIQDRITLAGQTILFSELDSFIANNDRKSFQSHGFLVSPRFGLAFDPNDKNFVTVFCHDDLEVWKA